MLNIIFVVVLVLVLAVLTALVLLQPRKRQAEGSYKGRAIMTDNEMEFFGRLVVALPDHYIFPQVAMSALLDPAGVDRKSAHDSRNRIAQQRVDYVVCNRRCEVVAVVELDDRTHSRAKDQLRDARLQQGGYKTFRFESRQKPSVDALRAAILPSVSPLPIADKPVALA